MRQQYDSAAAFRVGINDRLKAVARQSGRLVNEVRREFLFQQLLARVFSEPGRPWVLKGGTGLLVRLPGARYSHDVDLMCPVNSLDVAQAIADLRLLANEARGADFLRFEIGEPRPMSGQAEDQVAAKVQVSCFIGATRIDGFPVDLSMKLRPIMKTDLVQPTPIIDIPGVPALPPFSLYPLPDQIADKVCAMFGTYRAEGEISSRYHDLVDLVLIVSTTWLDGGEVAAALRAESKRRPPLELPLRLVSPGPAWTLGYAAEARSSSLAPALHRLDAALTFVGRCLDPLLQGVPKARWDPLNACWESDSEQN